MTDAPYAEADDGMSTIVLDQADRLFRQHSGVSDQEGPEGSEWPSAMWRAIEDAGLPLALVREEHGGIGLPVADAMRLVRLAAYHALPVPLAETMIAQRLWTDAGGELLEGVCTLAVAAEGDVGASEADGVLTLRGRVVNVPWGEIGQALVVVEPRPGHRILACIDGRAACTGQHRNLAAEPRDDLDLGRTSPAFRAFSASRTGADDLLFFGALIRAQQMIGAMDRCLEAAVAYANLRVQFGRPIGKFQSVQHMLAVAAGHVAMATAAADESTQAFDSENFGFAVAVAKACCSETAGRVAAIVHQVHGAIGFTKEYALQLSTRRLWSWRDEFGSDAFWQEQIGRLVCASGGEALWPLVLRERSSVLSPWTKEAASDPDRPSFRASRA